MSIITAFFHALRSLLLALLWPGIGLLLAHQWPGGLLQAFTMIELGMLGLALAGAGVAVGFGQWRVSAAFVLVLTIWSGLRFAGTPMAMVGLPVLILTLLPWVRERGFSGAGPILAGSVVILGIALWARGGGPATGVDSFLFDPLDLPVTDISWVAIFAALGLAAALGRLAVKREAIDIALTGMLASTMPLVLAPGSLTPLALALSAAAVLSLWTGLLLHAWRMAYIDELTRLPNRRALEERIQRLPREWAVAMLDIDHFKKFNDRWGHDVGDQVLRRVAAVLAGVGGGGQAYRYGGEEFTVIFAHANVERAGRAIEALRKEVGRQPFRVRGERDGAERRGRGGGKDMQRITISAGLALATELAPEAAFDKADKALYRAKAAGRNRLIQA